MISGGWSSSRSPAASTEALWEDAPNNARDGVEHKGPHDRQLWQLLECPGW